VDTKTRTTGPVYRDEAADLMAAAAMRAQPARTVPIPAHRKPVAPPVEIIDKTQPLPYPEPIGINDNDDNDVAEPVARAATERRRGSVLRSLARLVLMPLYLVVAIASLGLIFLFARGFIGL
jgi:hypothetical protein